MSIVITILVWMFIIWAALTLLGYTIGLILDLFPSKKPEPKEYQIPTMAEVDEQRRIERIEEEMYHLYGDGK